jgi:hypothetical protein
MAVHFAKSVPLIAFCSLDNFFDKTNISIDLVFVAPIRVVSKYSRHYWIPIDIGPNEVFVQT